MERWEQDLIRAMPKAELHLHLDGAVTVKTALDLARRQDWNGFGHPLTYEDMHRLLVAEKMVHSQEELLSYFKMPGILLQTAEALRRVCRELLLQKAADGVRYCEIRWAPLLHLQGGLTVPQVVEAVLAGRADAGRMVGIRSVLIAVALRSQPLKTNLALLERLIPYRDSGVAGVDFAGVEAKYPDPTVQLAYFLRAKQLGFHVTFHCGEIPGSAHILARAVEEIVPDRVAHGAVAAEDENLCRQLIKNSIMLDICPTSNLQAGLYSGYAELPVEKLCHMGVHVSINTDDPVLSHVTLSEEYGNILMHTGLEVGDLWRMNMNALEAGFADKSDKDVLRAEFAQWAEGVPELCPQILD